MNPDDPTEPMSHPPPPNDGLGGMDPGELLARAIKTAQPSGGASGWKPPAPEELARLLPQYHIESLLGHGGMGAVYKGRQAALDRAVAIKLLPAEMAADEQLVEGFQREARTLAKLQHPGIVTVHDFGQTSEGHLYFVMEYVEGAFTEIKLNGTVATVDRLQAGMKVAVTLSDPQTASKILATGNAPTGFGTPTLEGRVAPLGSGTVTPAGGRRITLRGKFEVDEIKVKDGVLWIDHQKFDKPSELLVNGVRWQPQWQGNISERFTAFKPPLQPFADAKVEVRKLKGRGEVVLKEPPTAENDHTLTVRIIDGPAGIDEYEVRITW